MEWMEDEEVENVVVDNIILPSDKECLKEFIRVWETCPELWNTSSIEYRDKVKRNLALDKLLEIYKKIKPASTKEDVKKKLNSLRTNFRKELNKVVQSKTSGTDEVYTPSSWTYFELLFLKKDKRLVQQRQDLEDDTEDDINTMTQDHQRYSISTMDLPSPPTFTGLKKKKQPGIDQQAFMERAVTFIDKIENDCSNSKLSWSEEYHLAKVWASKLQKLTSTQKILAEKAINDILFEAELENLKKRKCN